jgi:hypothetical protein
MWNPVDVASPRSPTGKVAPAAKPTDVRRCACALPDNVPIATNTNALLTTMRFIMNVLLVTSR